MFYSNQFFVGGRNFFQGRLCPPAPPLVAALSIMWSGLYQYEYHQCNDKFLLRSCQTSCCSTDGCNNRLNDDNNNYQCTRRLSASHSSLTVVITTLVGSFFVIGAILFLILYYCRCVCFASNKTDLEGISDLAAVVPHAWRKTNSNDRPSIFVALLRTTKVKLPWPYKSVGVAGWLFAIVLPYSIRATITWMRLISINCLKRALLLCDSCFVDMCWNEIGRSVFYTTIFHV